MVSKQITIFVGLPMIIVGSLIALLLAPNVNLYETVEFVGYLIGILGVIFFISGLFYKNEYTIS